ncbi:uncharacterized protein LAESUDRAFT_660239 [Laetiporus sulphureus 93-53]|uniref:Uncharacterized protein n=1 Tax=Laetiporus sulphureus 93-53 TaxID=1314785 RepID=A0A165CPC3_9APHY|nr:uncharacterized protein LAESUDRAFT_660239 [Laetiporus sulphureus 93-53]KZT03174.1 hypothetical protein LAESUDRAFT_660239 [Laetiporus sulphureus 93-53]
MPGTSELASTAEAVPPLADPSAALAWTQRLSMSLNAIAGQISAASQALAAVEVPASLGGNQNGDLASFSDTARAISDLTARLDAIERTQERLADQLDAVQEQIQRANGKESTSNDISAVEEESRESGSAQPEERGLAGAMKDLQKKVDGTLETIRLDQAWLYARLRNTAIANNKGQIKPLVMANGKTPPNFPGTKGEFEHLTKERYEHILKSYNQPIKGDTAAKREACREFLGLPPPS